jgi:hypothetical protein
MDTLIDRQSCEILPYSIRLIFFNGGFQNGLLHGQPQLHRPEDDRRLRLLPISYRFLVAMLPISSIAIPVDSPLPF